MLWKEPTVILWQVKVCRITHLQVQTALPTVVLTKDPVTRTCGYEIGRFSRNLSLIPQEGMAIPPGVEISKDPNR